MHTVGLQVQLPWDLLGLPYCNSRFWRRNSQQIHTEELTQADPGLQLLLELFLL